MKDYIVSTDSGCDLPAKLLEERGIIPFGLFYEIGGIKPPNNTNVSV